jgi:hypothetical protein
MLRPSAIVGWAGAALASPEYGSPAIIAVCTAAITSPAVAPIIVKPRMRSSFSPSIHAEMPVSLWLRSARNYVNPLSFDSIRVRWHALDHSYRSTEKPDDLIGNLRGGSTWIDRQRVLTRIRFFESVDLAL